MFWDIFNVIKEMKAGVEQPSSVWIPEFRTWVCRAIYLRDNCLSMVWYWQYAERARLTWLPPLRLRLHYCNQAPTSSTKPSLNSGGKVVHIVLTGYILDPTGYFEGAIRVYRTITEQDSTYYNVFYNLGSLLYEQGNIQGGQKPWELYE